MTLPDPPTYTVPVLERLASELLEEYLGSDVQIPVDVDYLLEQLEGVQLDYARGLREEYGLEGMVLRDTETGDLFILIDEWLADHSPNRYRSTVAEELAHIVLHGKVIKQIENIETFRELQQHPRCSEIERNAKRFAAAILMPGKAVVNEVQQVYPRLVHVAGFGNVPAVQNQLASLLAKRFVVSTETMKYRLREWPMRVMDRVADAMKDKLSYIP